MKARNAQGKLQKTLTGGVPIALAGASLIALGAGALWWPAKSMLCVSDLHLGKSERYARAGGATLPPYQTQGTLLKLESDLDAYPASTVICLGDSFDHPQAPSELAKDDRLWINRLQAGRDWIWIEGNHDPGPLDIGGSHRTTLSVHPLFFQHIAAPDHNGDIMGGEVSGHYHPKARLKIAARTVSRACFLLDRQRLILPAYGTYTGGLHSNHSQLQALMGAGAVAVLTGKTPQIIPMPRSGTDR